MPFGNDLCSTLAPEHIQFNNLSRQNNARDHLNSQHHGLNCPGTFFGVNLLDEF